MCRKQNLSSKNKKIFRDHPMQREQNKPIVDTFTAQKNSK